MVYAAIPNLANTLGEANRLFQDRLQQSPALQNWWKQQQKGNGPKLEEVLDQVKTFSSYLGDEIVFAVGKEGTNYTAPVVIAKVRQADLKRFYNEGRKLSSNPDQVALQTVHDPWAVTPAPGHPLLVYVSNELMVASPEVAELQRAVAGPSRGAAANLPVRRSTNRSLVPTSKGRSGFSARTWNKLSRTTYKLVAAATNCPRDSGREIPDDGTP